MAQSPLKRNPLELIDIDRPDEAKGSKGAGRRTTGGQGQKQKATNEAERNSGVPSNPPTSRPEIEAIQNAATRDVRKHSVGSEYSGGIETPPSVGECDRGRRVF